jgi:hypothetical protein
MRIIWRKLNIFMGAEEEWRKSTGNGISRKLPFFSPLSGLFGGRLNGLEAAAINFGGSVRRVAAKILNMNLIYTFSYFYELAPFPQISNQQKEFVGLPLQ